MEQNCFSVNDTPLSAALYVPYSKVIHATADDAGISYQIHQLIKYEEHYRALEQFDTIIESLNLVLVIDAHKDKCNRKDYFNLKEDLYKMKALLLTGKARCILLCDEESPLCGIFEEIPQ